MQEKDPQNRGYAVFHEHNPPLYRLPNVAIATHNGMFSNRIETHSNLNSAFVKKNTKPPFTIQYLILFFKKKMNAILEFL